VDMARAYRHLSLEERAMAEELGRSPATLSREFKRNSTPAYKVNHSCRAHDRAVKRKREAGRRTR
jgi:IS30 family transposase